MLIYLTDEYDVGVRNVNSVKYLQKTMSDTGDTRSRNTESEGGNRTWRTMGRGGSRNSLIRSECISDSDNQTVLTFAKFVVENLDSMEHRERTKCMYEIHGILLKYKAFK